MSRTVEPRSLISDEVKFVDINDELKISYIQWSELMREKGFKPDGIDAFFAGWVMANPVVRETFKKVRVQDKNLLSLEKELKGND